MKINRRESIKAIISVLGAPLLLGREAVAQGNFQFEEELNGFIAEDETDGWHKARAIYDFERGSKIAKERGKSEISFKGSVVIDDLDEFEKKHLARFGGGATLTYNGETFPIERGKVKLFTSDPAYEKQVRYLVYYLPFSTPKGQYVLSGYKRVRLINLNLAGYMEDMTTLYTHLHQGTLEGYPDSPKLGRMLGAGILYFDIKDIFGLIGSCKPPFPSPAPLKFFTIITGDAIRSIWPWPL